ncbi:hypothetical protein ICN48_06525 [Polynucleobacter sp. JS-Safj-400b-B2]|uniref:hypothetical protein n=1 Tax=Polynucleobacter sp. JS-Safj-400b-B2 TaxID=2576921 RepID=UPI001C0B7355|nr:hypothetical protein [Polynucleobacter sp. JS-Safj-400b-B2]MBU3625888.1 hypothetical protein [Polynucleobacter sp. JS-Safj-400b-B2]
MTWQPLGCNPVTYSCPAGYTLSGQTCSITVLSAAIPNYYCSNGVLSGVSCVTSSSYAASANWYCPSGGSLSGSACISSVTTASTYASSNPCLYGGGFIAGGPLGNGFCREMRALLPANTTIAASGWAVGSCQIIQGAPVCQVYNTNKTCPGGYTLSGSACTMATSYAASISSYSCISGGVLSGASCTITSSSAASISSYYCNSGVLTGSQCSTTVTVSATAN